MVPNNSTNFEGMSIMYKDLVVPALTNLEIYFTCLILGWKDSNDPQVRIKNPVLQVYTHRKIRNVTHWFFHTAHCHTRLQRESLSFLCCNKIKVCLFETYFLRCRVATKHLRVLDRNLKNLKNSTILERFESQVYQISAKLERFDSQVCQISRKLKLKKLEKIFCCIQNS